jgi:putative membrane protein
MVAQTDESFAPHWSPYCGAGPDPSDLLSRWNLDPLMIGGLFLTGAAYVVHRRRGGAGHDGLVTGALCVLAIAFVSPLCALSSALFSARIVHHAALAAVAAPLLAFGLPGGGARGPGLAAAAAIHALAFWAWHAPGAYAWALSGDAAYWMMQASIFGSAFVLWGAVRRVGGLAAAGALLATMIQTGLLGALLAFAPRALYAPHLATTQAWGLSPLADQQLAGLIMWAPMAGAYLLAALVLVGRSLGSDRHGLAAA